MLLFFFFLVWSNKIFPSPKAYVYENGCFLDAAIIVTSVLPQSASRNCLAQKLFSVHSATAAVTLTSPVPCSARGNAMLLVQSDGVGSFTLGQW